MGLSQRVSELTEPVERNAAPIVCPTPGFKPGAVTEGETGTIVSTPRSEPITEDGYDDLLREWGFDPAFYEVVEPVKCSVWQQSKRTEDGERDIVNLYAYKAGVRQTRRARLDPEELDRLMAPVRKARKRKPAPAGDKAFVVMIGDSQTGKPDGGGVDAVVERLDGMVEVVKARYTELRERGHDLGMLVVVFVGDLGEGCDGHYDMQTFGIELDRRDQNKVNRRLIRNALMAWSKDFAEVLVTAVAGNHGENRKDGKAFTSFNDNDDVAVIEQVAEILAANSIYDHVRFALPRGELSVCVEAKGTRIGLAHGHQANNPNQIIDWWMGQDFGEQPASAADLLVTGHFHHYRFEEAVIGRWWLQVPPLECESTWYVNRRGRTSSPGVATLVTHRPDGAKTAVFEEPAMLPIH